jgi:alpha-galactosidase
MMILLILYLLYCSIINNVSGLDNGLALTPPMGISTWSTFKGRISHTLIVDLTDMIIQLGLLEVGYTYLLVDAGWATNKQDCTIGLPNRNETGHLLVDETKFPNMHNKDD